MGGRGRQSWWVGASGLCRWEAGPAPHKQACSDLPDQHLARPRAPTQQQTPPWGLCQPPRLLGVHMAGGVAADEGFCHFQPKTGFGEGTDAGACPQAAGRPAMPTPQPPPARGAGNHSTPGRPSFVHPLIHSADSHCYAVWPWTSLLSSLACDVCHRAGGAWSSQLVSQGSLGGVGGGGGRKRRVGAAVAPTTQPMAAATLALPWSPRRVLESSSRPRTAEKGCPPPPIPFLFSGPLTIPPHIEGHKGGLLPYEVGSPFSPCDK